MELALYRGDIKVWKRPQPLHIFKSYALEGNAFGSSQIAKGPIVPFIKVFNICTSRHHMLNSLMHLSILFRKVTALF